MVDLIIVVIVSAFQQNNLQGSYTESILEVFRYEISEIWLRFGSFRNRRVNMLLFRERLARKIH